MTSNPHPYLAGLLGTVLAACSGSQADLSGTGDRMYKSGPVTGFGSLIVSGEAHDTGGARFEIDRRGGGEDELEVGMIVNLELDADGLLLAVEYDNSLAGPVEATGDGTLIVAGQTVIIDELTSFAEAGPDDLGVGDFVEVSGHETAAGQLLASFVGPRDPGSTVELQGRVADLDTAEQSFRIGPVTVRYGQAAEFEVSGGLSNGLLVEAAGSYDSQTRVLQAQRVASLQRVPPARANQSLEFSGLVRQLDDDQFLLDDLTVRLTGTTAFARGSREDLQPDTLVTVRGRLDESGALAAQLVMLQPRVDVEFEGEVETVDAQAGRITLLDGQVVELASDARIQDASAQNERRFGLHTLQAGDRVLISGFQDGDLVIALRLERRDADADGDGQADDNRVRGSIGSLDQADRSFSLQGITVRIGDTTVFEGYADEADFFDSARPGDEVSAEGPYDDGRRELDATRISAESGGPGAAN